MSIEVFKIYPKVLIYVLKHLNPALLYSPEMSSPPDNFKKVSPG